jgi:hypothetical protein
MAKARKLKVFRTPIGFHDAYVAAPSQKAALEAWGSDHDLFARGEAELVEDAALIAEPLAHPGEVIRRLRGTAEQQVAALSPAKSSGTPAPERKPKASKVPRPDRRALECAEEAVAAAEHRHEALVRDLVREEEAVHRRRRAAEQERDAELEKLRSRVERERRSYDAALEAWREAPA